MENGRYKVQGQTPDGWESTFWTCQDAYQCAVGGMCNFKGAVKVKGDRLACEVLASNGKVLATYRVLADQNATGA